MKTRTRLSVSAIAARAQRGAALLVALIFLVVLTVIGIGVVGTTTTEEKLARNFRDNDIAFAAAEAALRDAEIRITGDFKPSAENSDYRDQFRWEFDKDEDCNNSGLCKSLKPAKQPVYEHFSLSGAPSVELGTVTNSPSIAQVANQPRYLIEKTNEELRNESASSRGGYGSATKRPTVYRITALGFGRLSAQTVLQETFVSPRDQ